MSPARRVAGYGPTVPQTLCTTPAQGAAGVGGCTEVGRCEYRRSTPARACRFPLTPCQCSALTTPRHAGREHFSRRSQRKLGDILRCSGSASGHGWPHARVPHHQHSRERQQLTSGGPTPGTVQLLRFRSTVRLRCHHQLPAHDRICTARSQPHEHFGEECFEHRQRQWQRYYFQPVHVASASVAPKLYASRLLNYQENFATAFKTRYTQWRTVQNIPGTIYNSESGFYWPRRTVTAPGSVLPSALVKQTTELA